MKLDQYSTRRNLRPGLPSAEEIKKTTQAWGSVDLAKHEDPKTAVNNECMAAIAPRSPVKNRGNL
jgi:hypothetical protein